jgi:maleylpyruvate isomerase
LETAWASCTLEGWRGRGSTNRGEVAIADLPFRRWREVEVHHADLGLRLTSEGWSPEYVRRELARQEMTWKARLPVGLGGLPAAALTLPPHRRLAWLLGREQVEGLPDVEGF